MSAEGAAEAATCVAQRTLAVRARRTLTHGHRGPPDVERRGVATWRGPRGRERQHVGRPAGEGIARGARGAGERAA